LAEHRPFVPEEMLRAFDRHQVAYVLIGGVAANLYGSPHITRDVDVTPSADRGNLKRLAAALRDLDARIRAEGEPDGVAFDQSAETLARVRMLNLVTRFGDLDIAFEPSGTRGYDDLKRDAITIDIHGLEVPVASLADVIRSKEAAGRDKDRLQLPTLRRLLERLEG
jgi:predicted nucleotidyltransferase